MKQNFAFFALVCCVVLQAQYNKGTVFLKDSTAVEGLVKVRNVSGIKYKTTKDSKPTIYDYNHITGFRIEDENYIYIKTYTDFPPRIVKEQETGEITLYSTEIYSPGHMIPTGYAGGIAGMTIGGGSATIYYLKINGI